VTLKGDTLSCVDFFWTPVRWWNEQDVGSTFMKHFLEILANVRIGVAEVGATLGLIFLIVYATHAAWGDFIAPLLK
jgi:hypothetical protein